MVPSTLSDLFQRYFPLTQAKCARMLGDRDEAADIAQETFVRFCQSPVVAAPDAVRLKWIYQTATRLAIDHLRRRRKNVEVRAVDDEAHGPPPDDWGGDGARGGSDAILSARQWLMAIVEQTPDHELQVAIFARLDGMGHEEIAHVLGLSARTVRRILSRFDQRLAHLKEVLS